MRGLMARVAEVDQPECHTTKIIIIKPDCNDLLGNIVGRDNAAHYTRLNIDHPASPGAKLGH